MQIEQSSRMDIFTPSIFGKLKQEAVKKMSSGTEVIDLSIGSPDLPPHDIIRETLAEYSQKPNMYGYTLGGTRRFHEAVADYYKRRSNVELHTEEEILKTMGSQEGLVHLPLAFCDEGDLVLTTNPAYVAYDVGIKLAGAVPYEMPLLEENGFLPKLSDIPVEVAQKAKLLILNLPGNPVPAMPSVQFFEEVIAFAKKYQILVVHDAAYSELYFEGETPFSFLSVPGAKEVGVEVNSLSKSFSLAGARIAYIVGNAEVIATLKRLKSNLDYGTFEPIQEAAAVALDNAEHITNELRKIFKKRHEILTTGLTSLGWKVLPSAGGMFIWVKYPYDVDANTFAVEAIRQVGVVLVPGSAFGTEGEGYVRIALVQNEMRIGEAIKRLETLQF